MPAGRASVQPKTDRVAVMGQGSYNERARRLHEDATAAHKKWIKSLSTAQRNKLRQMGVLDPADDDPEVDGHNPCSEDDVANSSRARTDWDPAETDSAVELIAEKFDLPLEAARKILEWHEAETSRAIEQHEGDLLSIVVGGLIAAKNVRVSAAGLAFAAQLAGLNGYSSQTDFATKHALSRSAISKATKAWQRDLGISTSVHQKSEPACKTYSQVGKQNHWRRKKVSASDLITKLNS